MNIGQNQSRFKVCSVLMSIPGKQWFNVKHTCTVTDMEGMLHQYMKLIMYIECGV